MSDYGHHDIWMNGRRVRIKDIVDEKADEKSEFETETFSFIKEWLTGVTEFDLQTSGSTGIPKKIKVTRAMMKASAQLTTQALALKENYQALIGLDTRYVAGKMMLVRCLELGMRIFAVDPCANPLIKIPIDQTIHFTALVPYQVKAILDSNHPHLLDGLLTCIIGGAAVEENLHKQLQQFTTQFYVTYGMTETVSHIALQKITPGNFGLYNTLPGVTVESDERQCLVINAPFLLTKIVTNDIVEVMSPEKFRWIGRIDNVINSGGVKISAEMLEEKIAQTFTQLHVSNRFFVFGIPDVKLGQKVVLVMESPISGSLLDKVRKTFIHSISPYETPRDFFQVDQLVLTDTGKINRQESFRKATPLLFLPE